MDNLEPSAILQIISALCEKLPSSQRGKKALEEVNGEHTKLSEKDKKFEELCQTLETVREESAALTAKVECLAKEFAEFKQQRVNKDKEDHQIIINAKKEIIVLEVNALAEAFNVDRDDPIINQDALDVDVPESVTGDDPVMDEEQFEQGNLSKDQSSESSEISTPSPFPDGLGISSEFIIKEELFFDELTGEHTAEVSNSVPPAREESEESSTALDDPLSNTSGKKRKLDTNSSENASKKMRFTVSRKKKVKKPKKIFKCDNCDKLYKNKDSLLKHVRKFSAFDGELTCSRVGETDHYCQDCSVYFRSPGALISHMKRRHEEKTQSCPTCDFVNADRSAIWNHVIFKHGFCLDCPLTFEFGKETKRNVLAKHKRECTLKRRRQWKKDQPNAA